MSFYEKITKRKMKACLPLEIWCKIIRYQRHMVWSLFGLDTDWSDTSIISLVYNVNNDEDQYFICKDSRLFDYFIDSIPTINLIFNKTIKNDHLFQTPMILTKVILCENNIITDDGLVKLTNLRSLDITRNRTITDQCVSRLTRLEVLHLRENRIITDAGLITLNQLTHLNLLFNNNITDTGISHMTTLEELYISWNGNITSKALHLMTNLHSLGAVGNDNIKLVDVANLTRLINIIY